MDLPDFNSLLVLAAVSLAAAALALILTWWIAARLPSRPPRSAIAQALRAPRSYVFRDGYLMSDLDEEECFLEPPPDRARAWDDLIDALVPLHRDIPAAMARLAGRAEGFLLVGHIGADALSVAGTVLEGTLQITVAAADDAKARHLLHAGSVAAYQSELEMLRTALNEAPLAMWKKDVNGQIFWANATYLRLIERASDIEAPLVWPIRQVFADQLDPLPEEGTFRRCQLQSPDGETLGWFEVSLTRTAGGLLFSARNIDRLVAAETGLRNFVQTLSKTFAHLPIGLAIFDKRRELVLFNPALLTLSTLSPEWLSTRPSLFAFLDQLRERQRMPEPKDYKAWRAGLLALEQAAENGSYQEFWTLPTGQTYRVIGRPHPDGAIAFMFEDISSEVSLTRQFRADLDLYQAILDELDTALAMFSKEGQLTFSNGAYAALWGVDPREIVGTISLPEATIGWQAQANPSPMWGDIRSFASEEGERAAWSERVVLKDGRELDCRVSPLKGGAMLLAFRMMPPAANGKGAAASRSARRADASQAAG